MGKLSRCSQGLLLGGPYASRSLPCSSVFTSNCECLRNDIASNLAMKSLPTSLAQRWMGIASSRYWRYWRSIRDFSTLIRCCTVLKSVWPRSSAILCPKISLCTMQHSYRMIEKVASVQKDADIDSLGRPSPSSWMFSGNDVLNWSSRIAEWGPCASAVSTSRKQIWCQRSLRT